MANGTSIEQLLNMKIAGNLGKDYLIFIGIFLALLMALKIFERYIIRVLKQFAKKSKTEIDDIVVEFLDRIEWRFYLFISFYAATKFLALPQTLDKLLNYGFFIIAAYYGVKFITVMVDHFALRHAEKILKEDKDEDTTFISVLGKIAKISVWIIAVLLILSNLGVNITSLVAGLGIGGIAIAFALQNILEDLFSSFTIYFDKPFKKGDFIIIGQDMGEVKHIGIKSTRIQTLQGQELVVSNKELTSARINNYKKMERRRVVFSFGVDYSANTKKLRLINKIIKNILNKIKDAELSRVHFKEFGAFSLNYEVVYYLNTGDYAKYMDTQQQINLAIKGQFEKNGIAIAFPTQTIYLKNADSGKK